jgi:hypothetical protein
LAAAPQVYDNMQLYTVEVFERGDEENICTEDGLSVRRLEKIA